jgi:hypothetical protein
MKILITLRRVIFLWEEAAEIRAVMRFFSRHAAKTRKRFPEILQ